ncbi:MAG: hypothetical protein IT449_11590 [Phycisphaerales bacterium]|nr:hypothetical protein [Phycisphaerales bacterium]
MHRGKCLAAATVLIGGWISGCGTAPKGGASMGAEPQAAALSGSEASAPDPREGELAAEVERAREGYHRHLLTLHDFYAANGFEAKRKWAEFELKGLSKVKAYRYASSAPADPATPSPAEAGH